MQKYCCFRREPQSLCSRLKEIALLDSVAEWSFTGIETSPKETVSVAIDREAMGASVGARRQNPILDQEDIALSLRLFRGYRRSCPEQPAMA